MKFVRINKKLSWRIEDINGVRDEGPHCSVWLDGEWRQAEMTYANMLSLLEQDGE